MVESKMMDVEFGKRLVSLREGWGLSRAAAAKQMRVGLSALQQYEAGALPGPVNAKKIQDFYKCNKSWLLTGEGSKCPQASGPIEPASVAHIEEEANIYNKDMAAPAGHPEIRISEAMAMTARVLESGTTYATALYLNIVHFDRAVQSESAAKAAAATISKCHEDIRVQGEMIVQMQARLDAVEKENRRLQEEMSCLTAAGGDCPPIALAPDAADPTGTDDPGT